jgi:hypothetical protein
MPLLALFPCLQAVCVWRCSACGDAYHLPLWIRRSLSLRSAANMTGNVGESQSFVIMGALIWQSCQGCERGGPSAAAVGRLEWLSGGGLPADHRYRARRPSMESRGCCLARRTGSCVCTASSSRSGSWADARQGQRADAGEVRALCTHAHTTMIPLRGGSSRTAMSGSKSRPSALCELGACPAAGPVDTAAV